VVLESGHFIREGENAVAEHNSAMCRTVKARECAADFIFSRESLCR
jgi:hypothetical protein